MPNQGKVVALHSNDVVFLAWQYNQKIDQCLGFSVRRKDLNKTGSDFQALPAWVGWQGGSNADWKAQNTDVWPVQKFNWRDFTARGRRRLSVSSRTHDRHPNLADRGQRPYVNQRRSTSDARHVEQRTSVFQQRNSLHAKRGPLPAARIHRRSQLRRPDAAHQHSRR